MIRISLFVGVFLCLAHPAAGGQPQTVLFEQAKVAELSVPDSTAGDTWFVNAQKGSDSNDGRTPATAFKTLSKAFDRYRTALTAGDTIKLMAGKYYGSIQISTNIGTPTAEKPLTIGPYGDGEVIIDASQSDLLTWTVHDANVFKADYSTVSSTATPGAVVLADSFKSCRPVYQLSDVNSYGKWYFDSASRYLYVHTGGASPPALDVVVVQQFTGTDRYGVYSAVPFVKIYGLTIRGATTYGISNWTSTKSAVNTSVEWCTLKHNGKAGVVLYGGNGRIVNCHVWGNVLLNWPRGRTWAAQGGWPQGATIDNYGLVRGNVIHDNGGEGTGTMDAVGHNVFEDNVVYDNWSANIYPDGHPFDTIRRNRIYCNDPDVAEALEASKLPDWIGDLAAKETYRTTKILQRMRAEGIMVGSETASPGEVSDYRIYNNLVVNCRRGFTFYGQKTGSGLKRFTVAYNTFVTPVADASYGEYSGMNLPYNSGNNVDALFYNNILLSDAANSPLVVLGSGTDPGVVFDRNVYYAGKNARPFKIGSYPNDKTYDFEGWKTQLPAFDRASYNAAPKLLGQMGQFDAAAYRPSVESPAVGKAVSLPDITTDLHDFPRSLSSSIGALELNSIPRPSNMRVAQ